MSDLVFCKNCVMDGTAKEITFDAFGMCNFCATAQKELALAEMNRPNLPKIIEQIKKDGKGKDYDVLIGLSGGVDSSTTLHRAVELGLRPLCYSVDNGWQSDIAQANVMKMVEGLRVPFFRRTIDLVKFRELQSAFMKAGQINIEIPTDHLIYATSYELAAKYNIKWILSGGNVSEESIMPLSFGYQSYDLKHIKSVYKWATGKNLTGLPLCGILKFNYYRWVKRIRVFYLLDYL